MINVPPAEVQEMYEEMLKDGVPPTFADIILNFRYNPDLMWRFGNVLLNGNPTAVVIFPRAQGGQSALVVVTEDMRMTQLDGSHISGPPPKDKAN